MGEVTRAEFDRLSTMVEETYWLTRGTLQQWVGKEKADAVAASVKEFCDPKSRRLAKGTPIYTAGLDVSPERALRNADLLTVEELAQRGRDEIALLPGVGRVALGKLDSALAEHGLAWAEAA